MRLMMCRAISARPYILARIGRGGGADEGVTTGASLPRLAPLLLPYAHYLALGSHGPNVVKDLAARRDAQLRGHLSRLILSSVRHLLVGPGGCCSPRDSVPLYSRDESAKCVG